jgi:hypothetical protein
MHYTILHLGSGQEVHEVKQKMVKTVFGRNVPTDERYYELKTFANIREVRNYINRFRFYEDVNGMIISSIIRRWDNTKGKADNQCSKHTLQAKQHDD